jgi:3-dehydroquinate synthase class II
MMWRRIKNLVKRITIQMVWAVILLTALFIYLYQQDRMVKALEMVSGAQVAHNALESGILTKMDLKFEDIRKETNQTNMVARYYFDEAKQLTQEMRDKLKGKRYGKK